MRSKIATRVKRAIQEKVFPGCIVGTIRANGVREILPFGHFTYDENSPEVRGDSIYDVASITKSIPTASLALMLMGEGKLRVADRVVEFLPELKNDYGATVEDLLTYHVHGTPLSTLAYKSADEILEYIFAYGFDGPPSGESKYTNLPALLLGLIVERVAKEKLDVLAQKTFFDPLSMRTTFFPTKNGHPMSTIAPTEIDEWRGLVQGLPHDESAYVFAKAGRAVGHAGLFSTASDLLNFLGTLLDRNYGCATSIIEGAQRGWGWQVNDAQFMGKYSSPHTFGKTGFTGTSVICDVERGIGFVILSNRTYPKRPPDDSAIFQFRADIADSILGSV